MRRCTGCVSVARSATAVYAPCAPFASQLSSIVNVSLDLTALLCIVCVNMRPSLQRHTVLPRASRIAKSCVRPFGKRSSTVFLVLFVTRNARSTWLPVGITSRVVATVAGALW